MTQALPHSAAVVAAATKSSGSAVSILVNFPRHWERNGAERAFGAIQFPEINLVLPTKRTVRPMDQVLLPPKSVQLGLLDLQCVFPGRVQATLEARQFEMDPRVGRIWIVSSQLLGKTTSAVESALHRGGFRVVTWQKDSVECSVL